MAQGRDMKTNWTNKLKSMGVQPLRHPQSGAVAAPRAAKIRSQVRRVHLPPPLVHPRPPQGNEVAHQRRRRRSRELRSRPRSESGDDHLKSLSLMPPARVRQAGMGQSRVRRRSGVDPRRTRRRNPAPFPHSIKHLPVFFHFPLLTSHFPSFDTPSVTVYSREVMTDTTLLPPSRLL